MTADEASAAATALDNPAATPEKSSPFTPTSIIAGILGGLGALWLLRRRARAQDKAKPNA